MITLHSRVLIHPTIEWTHKTSLCCKSHSLKRSSVLKANNRPDANLDTLLVYVMHFCSFFIELWYLVNKFLKITKKNQLLYAFYELSRETKGCEELPRRVSWQVCCCIGTKEGRFWIPSPTKKENTSSSSPSQSQFPFPINYYYYYSIILSVGLL